LGRRTAREASGNRNTGGLTAGNPNFEARNSKQDRMIKKGRKFQTAPRFGDSFFGNWSLVSDFELRYSNFPRNSVLFWSFLFGNSVIVSNFDIRISNFRPRKPWGRPKVIHKAGGQY
jgi:hypothetical protein